MYYSVQALTDTVFFLNFFYDKAYLGINSKKLVTNGKYHIVTADKNTPR